MKKEYLKEIRTIVSLNFIIEIIQIITLYLSSTQILKIGKVDILNFLSIILGIISIFLIFRLLKKMKNDKYNKLYIFIIVALSIYSLILFLSIISKLEVIIPYLPILSSILVFIPLIYFYKYSNKNIKKNSFFKNRKFIVIIYIMYSLSKIFYILTNIFNEVIVRSIFSTISIIGVVITYTLYMKFLEKALKDR